MSALPTISIVTPSYNQGGFIESTIRSVLDQGYPNLEYIIMDGGSTDGTLPIIRKYASHLAHWQSAPDKGQADAIARGFGMATGEIICWLNSDDLLLPGALHHVAEFFLEHPYDECVVGGCLHIDGEGRPLLNRDRLPTFTYGVKITFDKLLFSGCGFNQPASFWKREAFVAAGGLDVSLHFAFDYDLFLRLSRRRPFGVLKKFVACFRIHGESKTSTLQDLCARESEMLWKKYGRYDGWPIRREILSFYHYWKHMFINRCYQTEAMMGMLKLPSCGSPDRAGS